jgi:hypothetical protein
VAGLARRTWATAQSTPQLLAHLEWWRAYYHFSRPHGGLRVPLAAPVDRTDGRRPPRARRRTPAMALGVTDHPWTVRELLTYPLPPRRAQCANDHNRPIDGGNPVAAIGTGIVARPRPRLDAPERQRRCYPPPTTAVPPQEVTL